MADYASWYRGTPRHPGTQGGYRRPHARNVAIDGETTNDLFAFLTTEPNAEVGIIQLKAMPLILTMPSEVKITPKLQRPRPDAGRLKSLRRASRKMGPNNQ